MHQLAQTVVYDMIEAHGGQFRVLPFFNLVEVWNSGVSFGMFRNLAYGQWILSVVSVVITLVMLGWLWRAQSAWMASALSLMIGGAVGNLIDRVRFGAVADYLDFHAFGYHWPAFNITDMAICAGAFLLIADSLLKKTSIPSDAMTDIAESVSYRITGMDCPSCAAKIEKAVGKIAAVQNVKVSIASQIMNVRVENSERHLPEIEHAVTELGYRLKRQSNFEDEDLPKDLAHIAPAYKRALWIVVLLNIGYGIVEMAGGFISHSQALKADALDFLGDGLITLLGLAAIGWSLTWRARSAFIQGIFLGALGFGVLAATAYRVLVLQQPEAELMGLFGAVALCVNVGAAFVLLPHRAGDSNVRAVWLFSRNDAIGNAAVVVAAVLVAWTNTPWPDLAVAVIIACLFLHSSWAIIKDARADLT